jgi:hypothetical protein
MKTVLESFTFCSATTDGWTAPNGGFVSFTVHTCTAAFELRELLLRCAPFKGRFLRFARLTELDRQATITKKRCRRFSRRRPATLAFWKSCWPCALTTTRSTHLQCANSSGSTRRALATISICWSALTASKRFALLMRVRMFKCRNQVPELKSMVAAFRTLVAHFKHSNLAREAVADFRRRRGESVLNVIQDVPTR